MNKLNHFNKFYYKVTILSWLCILLAFTTLGQEVKDNDTSRNDAVKVYIDCNSCDADYIRTEIPFINYVRDRKEADVHILITRQRTGSGGREYSFVFFGQEAFKDMNDTLTFTTFPDDTDDKIREGTVHTLKLGLVRYVAKTSLASELEIKYKAKISPTAVVDKWNNWVFGVNFGIWANGQEVTNGLDAWTSIDIRKVTPEWKMEFEADASYNESNYNVDSVTTISSYRRYQGLEGTIVKSLGSHFSVGAWANVYSSLYNNIGGSFRISPAIEYNIFPYEESTRRQIRIAYRPAYRFNQYNDTTIYDKIEEGLFNETLSIAAEIQEKWGSVNASVEGSHFFYDLPENKLDFSKNKITIRSNINLKVFKGFSVRLSGNFSIIHDQIGLPKGGATTEEILTRQKELATQYQYWGNVSINYTFGSIYNNVVNPRFGN